MVSHIIDPHGDCCGAGSATLPEDTLPVSTKRRSFLKGLGVITGATVFGGTAAASEHDEGDEEQEWGEQAKNGIIIIHDGMAQGTISGARYLKAYQNDPDTFPLNVDPAETQLHVDRHEAQGTATTFPSTANEVITDSASAATHMAATDCSAFSTGISAGVKTYPGAIGGFEEDGEFVPVETILERAQAEGLKTGLVTTTRLTHATPAGFGAHVPTRFLEDEIARQYLDEQDIDVLLGGGMRHFDPKQRDDNRDLLYDAEEEGYRIVETAEELAAVNETPVLGLFADSHLDLYLDREHHPSAQPGLVEMTEKALELLQNPNGFFLMMEAGRIDHCGHYNDPSILHEQIEGDEATGTCLDFAQDPETGPTTVITTSDHECGGFTLGRDGIHNVNFELISQLEASVVEGMNPEIRDVMPSVDNYREIIEEIGGLNWEILDRNLTDRDIFWIIYLGPVFAQNGSLREFLNKQMMFGFTSFGHTGVDVPLWADGPNAEFFNTARDNTDVPNALAATLGIDSPHS